MQGSMATMQGDMAIMQGDMATMQSDVTTIQGDMATMQGAVAKLEEDMTAVKSSVVQLEESMSVVRLSTMRAEMEHYPRIQAALDGLSGAIDHNKTQDSRILRLERKTERHDMELLALQKTAT
jgi:phage-related tail protein